MCFCEDEDRATIADCPRVQDDAPVSYQATAGPNHHHRAPLERAPTTQLEVHKAQVSSPCHLGTVVRGGGLDSR